MKVKYFCWVLVLFALAARAQTLSEQSTISVITCGPGQDELYSAFGHSAFRVFDPVNQIDEAYNYGVFDFRQKNFYLNFARGYLYYKLGVHDYRAFEYHYIADNRFVHQQVLNLTPQQKQRMYDFLLWNAQPENQHYRYDYFYDNCATKMRDVIKQVLGDTVQFDGSFITTDYTIRELTDIYLPAQPWGDLGIDICLGLPMDKKASPYEYMFLPDYIESSFNHATIRQAGVAKPLVLQTIRVFDPPTQDLRAGFFQPFIIFGIMFLAVAALTYRDFTRKRLTTWFDATFFSVLGAIGLLLLLLWTATDHRAAANNLNLLWALPTHLVAVIAMIRRPAWLSRYFQVVAILAVLLLILWPVLPQQMHTGLIPIVMIAGLRAFARYRLGSNVSATVPVGKTVS